MSVAMISIGTALVVIAIFPRTKKIAGTFLTNIARFTFDASMLTDLAFAAIEIYVTVCISVVGTGLSVSGTSTELFFVSLLCEAFFWTVHVLFTSELLSLKSVVAPNSLVLFVVHVTELATSFEMRDKDLPQLPTVV